MAGHGHQAGDLVLKEAASAWRAEARSTLVTCSVGLASWDFQEAGAELVQRADQALYLAKAEGRNRFVTA